MPTYELHCRACEERFELFMTRFIRVEDKVCPFCGSCDVDQGLGGGFVAPIQGKTTPAPGCSPGGGFS